MIFLLAAWILPVVIIMFEPESIQTVTIVTERPWGKPIND